VPRLSLQFAWRFLGLEGSRPELDSCVSCGRRLEPGDHALACRGAGGLQCTSCAGTQDGVGVGPGSRRYLAATAAMSLVDSMRVGLTSVQEQALSRWIYDLVELILEVDLNSLVALRGLR
jgi:recombinational DNA repair protein (RecF pathway)